MQYDAETPAEYLEQLEDDWRREKLHQLRALIRDKAPEYEEGIEFKMLGYSDGAGSVFHLNAQKHHVGLYVGNASKIDADGDLLAGIDVGKGCLRFRKSLEIGETRVDEFLEKAVEMRRTGADFGC